MQVLYSRGIHLPGPQLWLDPHDPRPVAVVSHAHADHVQRHDHVITSAPTAAMMRLRGVTRCRFRAVPFREAVQLGGARMTLYPAGHILGSAQALVEWEGTRLLYSGDFKLRPGKSAEPVEVPKADVVIMETTFGKPRYRFPDTEEVVAEICRFCHESLEAGSAPVLFCYSLGKGQELLACLASLGRPIYLHTAHWDIASLYRDFGVALPPFRKFQPGQKLDGVLLCAAGSRKAQWFQRLGAIRTAYISGWAMDRGAAWRFGTDAAFPLSDHADYDDLHEYVRLTGAQRIYTMHGFADEFAGELRRLGHWAEPLREPGPQLALF
jgi:Cft2 family RNA processing exonuclease